MESRRLFFALWPSDRQREMLRDTIQPALSTIEGRAVDRRNWHVTLVFVGQFPESRLAALQEAIAGIPCVPFRLRFDQLTYWPRPKIACLQPTAVPDELQRLVDDIQEAVEPFDVAPEEHAFRPHITVARRVRAFQPQRLARPVELQWSEFTLVESVTLPGGAQYHPLKQRVRRES